MLVSRDIKSLFLSRCRTTRKACFTLLASTALALSPIIVSAQQLSTVISSSKYYAELGSVKEARQHAIEAAMQNALPALGIDNPPQTDYFLRHFRDHKAMAGKFESIRTAGTRFELVMDSIVEEKTYYDQLNRLVVEVSLSVSVYQHNSLPDTAFSFSVAGIDRFYHDGDFMRFVFTPGRNGYLNILWVSPDGSRLLYPFTEGVLASCNDDPDFLFEGQKSAFFPMARAFREGYCLEPEQEPTEPYPVLLVFIYTREPLKLDNKGTLKEWMKKVFSIPQQEKAVKQQALLIKPF